MFVTGDSKNAGFPSKERPNREKDEKYVLAWVQAIHAKNGTFPRFWLGGTDAGNTGMVPTIWHNYETVRRTRMWSRGQLDVTKYKAVHRLNDSKALDILTSRNITWELPQDHMPYLSRLRNEFTNRDTVTHVTVLDKDTNDRHVSEMLADKAAAIMNSDPEMKAAAQQMGVDITPAADKPQTPQEWDMFQQMGSKPAIAYTIEATVEAVKSLQEYMYTVRPFLADALIDDNVTVVMVHTNDRGVPYAEVIPYDNCFLPSTRNNWADMETFGYRLWMTPSEIFAMMGDKATPAVRKRILKMATRADRRQYESLQRFGPFISNPNVTEDGVEVVFGTFLDYNTFDVTERKSDGIAREYQDGDENLDPSEYDIRRNQYTVAYQGYWIPGTKDGPKGEVDHGKDMGAIYWGCHLAYSQARMKNTLWKTELPVAVRAYDMSAMTCTSIGRRMEMAYDKVVTADLQMKALLCQIIPQMIVIDKNWLNKATVTADGSGQLKMSDIIKAALESGVLVVQSRDPDNPDDQGGDDVRKAIQIHPAYMPDFVTLATLIQSEMARFERVAGFNMATSGQTIDERAAVRNVQMMKASQQLALKPITDCQDYIEMRVAKLMYGILQCTLKSGNEHVMFEPLLGNAVTSMVKWTADTDPGSIGVEVRSGSTEEERLMLEEHKATALANDKISFDDVLFIDGIRNKKQAAQILSMRIKTRDAERQRQALEQVQAQGQNQAQAMEQARETMQVKSQLDSQKSLQDIDAKKNAEAEILQLKAVITQQEQQLQIAAQGDADMRLERREMGALMLKMDRMMEQIMVQSETALERERIASGSRERVAEMDNESREKVAESRPSPENA
jgi:hypothetical protein